MFLNNSNVSFLSAVGKVVVSGAHGLMLAGFESHDISQKLRRSIIQLRVHLFNIWIV